MAVPDKIRIAWMGFGHKGSILIDRFRELNLWGKAVTCAGVYDVSEQSARKNMELVDVKCPFYSDADELFQREKPHACYISSIDSAHLENFRVAVKYNVPVMVEKPLEVSLETAAEFLHLAAGAKAPVLMAHNMRFCPILNRAKEIISAAEVGTIHSIRFHNNIPFGSTFFRQWFRLRRNVGSLICEKGSHDIDIMNFLSQSYPVKVFALSKRYEYGGDRPNDLRCPDCPEELDCPESRLNRYLNSGIETVKASNLCVYAEEADISDDDMCVMEFENGIQAVYVQTFYTPRSYKHRLYTLVGSMGILEIDLGETEGDIVFYPRYGSKKETRREHFDYHMRNHYNSDIYLAKHFYRVIVGEERPRCGVRDGYIAVVAALAATQSADERRIVDVKSLYQF